MGDTVFKTDEELEALIRTASERIVVGGLYKHYRNGKNYLVKDLSIWRPTGEVCVRYEAQYGKHAIFVRPLEEWTEEVENEGQKIPRFQYQPH